jgi:hypothetical protein
VGVGVGVCVCVFACLVCVCMCVYAWRESLINPCETWLVTLSTHLYLMPTHPTKLLTWLLSSFALLVYGPTRCIWTLLFAPQNLQRIRLHVLPTSTWVVHRDVCVGSCHVLLWQLVFLSSDESLREGFLWHKTCRNKWNIHRNATLRCNAMIVIGARWSGSFVTQLCMFNSSKYTAARSIYSRMSVKHYRNHASTWNNFTCAYCLDIAVISTPKAGCQMANCG